MKLQSMNRLLADDSAPSPSTMRSDLTKGTRADIDTIRGRIEGRAGGATGAKAGMAAKLDKLVGRARVIGSQRKSTPRPVSFDQRQRAIVKIHYFSNFGAGGAAMRAHGRYIARAGVSLPEQEAREPELAVEQETAPETKAPDKPSDNTKPFYGPAWEGDYGAELIAKWSREDQRHFRLMLSPENGEALGDLRAYTREVMARAQDALGTNLEWVAVDHWDTDNAHTHIVLRGVRSDGKSLVIPRDYVKYGFRDLARDIATERLGLRTREDARLALEREARAHRPTRLDALLAPQLDGAGSIAIAKIQAPNNNPALRSALKTRLQELKRLGLAHDIGRFGVKFVEDWRGKLAAMERHLDIRKEIVRTRTINQQQTQKLRLERQRGLDR